MATERVTERVVDRNGGSTTYVDPVAAAVLALAA